jgi:hypothetical protein
MATIAARVARPVAESRGFPYERIEARDEATSSMINVADIVVNY